MSRITMFDDLTSAVTKLCNGNPGAINACCVLIKEGAHIYPYTDGCEYLMTLDSIGIYGTDIYVLWSDICQRDLEKMIQMLRIATIDPSKADLLKDACSRQDYSGRRLLQEDKIFGRIFD